MSKENTRSILIFVAAAVMLSIPLVAGFPWSAFDFAIAGALLFGTAFAIELVLRTVKKFEHRLVLCGFVFAALALIWIELAVGFFGTPIAGN